MIDRGSLDRGRIPLSLREEVFIQLIEGISLEKGMVYRSERDSHYPLDRNSLSVERWSLFLFVGCSIQFKNNGEYIIKIIEGYVIVKESNS